MSSEKVQTLFKEARLNLEPASNSSITQIPVPGRSFSANKAIPADDERAYKTRSLATASSIFHRKHHSSPRSFLWRVLENNTVLSIRSADVYRQANEPEISQIIHLRFSNAIRSSCIGFADREDDDALCIFVLDEAKQLHYITLRPDSFKKAPIPKHAFSLFTPQGLGFKEPHRLAIVNHDQLVITMHEGGILRLDKHGLQWKETVYNVAGWAQSFRGLVPLRRTPTIRYGRVNMEVTAATSTAISSMGRSDMALLFTVCLDHHLRVWDVRTGQILYTGDILNANRDPQELGKWTIDPSQSNLIRILQTNDGQFLITTFSPIDLGEFKFWKAKANQSDSILISDALPETSIVPSSSLGDYWTLADFAVTEGTEGLELWTLWKDNISYRVQRLPVALDGQHSSQRARQQWSEALVQHTVSSAPPSSFCDPIDTTEKWLRHIFYPGRFARSTIETAQIMYEKGLSGSKDASSNGSRNRTESLCSSLCAILGSSTTLERTEGGDVNYDRLRVSSETQWMRFWRLLLELDKQRGEALSLVLDDQGMPWITCADYVSIICPCSRLEILHHNAGSCEMKENMLCGLLSAGLGFLDNFNEGVIQQARTALLPQIFEDLPRSDEDCIQQFYDNAGFWRELEDVHWEPVQETFGPKFGDVTERLYTELFELILNSSVKNSQALVMPYTGFGRKVAVRAIQETVDFHWRILMSQLVLLVQMEFEIDDDGEALHSRFDIGSVYRRLISILRRLEQVRWMAATEINDTTLRKRSEEMVPITALEKLTGHLMGVPEGSHQSLAESITEVAQEFCTPGSATELDTALLQCSLLTLERPDLALELSPFASQDPFPTYIQGRVFLALKDYGTAASYFRKASVGMSTSMRNEEDRHSAGLLDDTEWNQLHCGLPSYYSHVVGLYDRQKAYSYAMEFARLSLQFVRPDESDDRMIKTEMLSRLFVASTATSHFDVAHSALLSMRNEALQRSYLRKLVEKMCETGQNAELINLPFSGLQTHVDDILEEKCKAVKDVRHGIPYHQILYAWRISQNDHRGGATVLLDRLQKMRQMGEGDHPSTTDALDTQVTHQYLLLINALSCITANEAYILENSPAHDLEWPPGEDLEDADIEELIQALDAEMEQSTRKLPTEDRQLLERFEKSSKRQGVDLPPRRFLTLPDLRRQYQAELDRIVAIQNNQFSMIGDDDMMEIA